MGAILSRGTYEDEETARARDRREHLSRWKNDDKPPPKSPRRRRRHGSRGSRQPVDFPWLLADRGMKREDVDGAPLFTERMGMPMIRVRALQHMVVAHLRREIAGEVAEIVEKETATGPQMEAARKTMKHYVTALRDLRYMLEPPSQNTRTERFLRDLLYIKRSEDSAILVDAGLISLSSLRREPQLVVPNYTGHGGHRSQEDFISEKWDGFLSRLKMALFGGLALIAPMLIMRLLPYNALTELLTTSCFVLVVGIILAWYMSDADKKDILGATAAYAAVLVVFVGTSAPLS